MRRFEYKDIDDEIMDATASCDTPEEVRRLFASRGFDLSEKTAQKFFDFTRTVALDDEEAANVAGGGCSESDSSSTCSS